MGLIRTHRAHQLWLAYWLHRWSGIGLAVFLPVHFYVLGLSLQTDNTLNDFLSWADQPWVKLMESGLVILLSVHLFGGIRILVLEFLPWHSFNKTLAALVLAGGAGFGMMFLLKAF